MSDGKVAHGESKVQPGAGGAARCQHGEPLATLQSQHLPGMVGTTWAPRDQHPGKAPSTQPCPGWDRTPRGSGTLRWRKVCGTLHLEVAGPSRPVEWVLPAWLLEGRVWLGWPAVGPGLPRSTCPIHTFASLPLPPPCCFGWDLMPDPLSRPQHPPRSWVAAATAPYFACAFAPESLVPSEKPCPSRGSRRRVSIQREAQDSAPDGSGG